MSGFPLTTPSHIGKDFGLAGSAVLQHPACSGHLRQFVAESLAHRLGTSGRVPRSDYGRASILVLSKWGPRMMSRTSVALGNLRAVVIIIVVAFHSVLPYLATLPSEPYRFDAPPYRWLAFPIIDGERWFGFDLFCAWQDVSLMSLMFFLAGLLAAPSLRRKGATLYMWDRLMRIGLPFLLAVTFLSPLAYYASYRATAVDPGLAAFWTQWLALPFWPSGPPWFLWQLFVLSALAAALHAVAPHWTARLGAAAERLHDRPVGFFAILVAASAIAYVPLALVHTPFTWDQIGPFSLQLSRPLHYVVYFFAGFALGAAGLDRGLLTADGPFARHWLAWLVVALVSFGLWGSSTSLTMPDWHGSPLVLQLAAGITFAIACAAGGLALLGLCLRWLRERNGVLDSLSGNAYSIYLLHYVPVLWLQYALLSAEVPAVVKAAVVCSIALMLSWAASAAIGKVSFASPARAPMRGVRQMATDQQR
jgi:hypothetical protein